MKSSLLLRVVSQQMESEVLAVCGMEQKDHTVWVQAEAVVEKEYDASVEKKVS